MKVEDLWTFVKGENEYVERHVSAAEVAEALRAEGYLVIGRDENGEWPTYVKYGWVTSRLTGSIATTTRPDEADVLIVPFDALAESSKGVE